MSRRWTDAVDYVFDYLTVFPSRSLTKVDAPPEDARKVELIAVEPGVLPAKHHGSCHCGDVQIELLADIAEVQVKEDNCSSCVRVRTV